MEIKIKSIPHDTQLYPTCGDWWFKNDGSLQIRVSQEMPEESQYLIALHELAEAIMCHSNGVTQKSVDDFDIAYEKNRKPDDYSEPGDNKCSPYFKQHGMATAIERIAATQMKVEWPKHEEEISKLFD